MMIEVLERRPGLARIRTAEGTALWAVSTLRSVRHPRTCWDCGRTLIAGDEAYRPVGNQMYRGKRLCRPCVE